LARKGGSENVSFPGARSGDELVVYDKKEGTAGNEVLRQAHLKVSWARVKPTGAPARRAVVAFSEGRSGIWGPMRAAVSRERDRVDGLGRRSLLLNMKMEASRVVHPTRTPKGGLWCWLVRKCHEYIP
jgi:hypothetical protein